MILAEQSDDSFPLQLTVSRDGFGGVTGLTPTVELRLASTLDTYWDFSGEEFLTSGWVQKAATLTEIANGHYAFLFDINASGISISRVLSAEFHFETGSTKGDTSELISIVENIMDIPTTATIADAVWDEDNSAHSTAGSTGLNLENTTSRVATVLADTEVIQPLVSTNLDATVSSRAVPGDEMAMTSAARGTLVDAVWDEVVDSTAHFTSNTTGEALTILRGLTQQNFCLDETTYNAAGLLTAGRIRIFTTKAEVESATDGGTGEGEIATFSVTTEAESTATQAKVYKSVRDS